MIYGLAKSNPGGFGQATVLVPLLVGILLLTGFVFHALRTSDPLVDLRLFLDRTFTTSSITLLLVVISVFGSFLLLPLYFQAVRGASALQSGLLLAPQGFGSMITMPIAGQLSDRTGPGRIVPFGLILVALSVLALTQIGANTSYVLLEAILFVFGLGMGFTMMPVFTGAMQSMREAMVARASTALNIIQQTGASIGTAVLSVVLATAISSELGSAASGGIGATIGLSDAARAKIAGPMADAFGHTFWWATALLVIALVGSLALPRQKPELAHGASPATAVI
jgi:predicted MFS family arabinose efflux permease